MSRTVKQKKRVKHGRINFQIPLDELEEFDRVCMSEGLSRSCNARLVINKHVMKHRMNKKEVE